MQATQVTALPRIDAHSVEVDASPGAVWVALLEALPRGFSSSRVGRAGAAALGCEYRRAEGPLDRRGSTLTGFRVASAEPPSRLALEGEHRFSRYALTFDVEPIGDGSRSRLSATTDAAFPGPHGRAYRALVIGTRSHVVLVRRLLDGVRRSAERREPAQPA